MNKSDTPISQGIRQRKLDDLFGDEPFLSPTMKARQLHGAADHPIMPESTETTDRQSTSRTARDSTAPRLTMVDTSTGQDAIGDISTASIVSGSFRPTEPAPTKVRLVDAAAQLRAEQPSGGAPTALEHLWRFRANVLLRWLRHLPPRETDEATEDH